MTERVRIVAFRVDSSSKIGTGHVARCLTLANALREGGMQCHFICRDHTDNAAEMISGAGHGLTMLAVDGSVVNAPSAPYLSWLGAELIDDADDTIACLKDNPPAWLVVDHYAIDERWERHVKEGVDTNIMVIDGQANHKHHCDLLLDPTLSVEGQGRWQGRVPSACKLYIGPGHALLRPEFLAARRNLRQRSGEIRRVFIGFGGVDEPNATGAVLDAVSSLKHETLTLDVVLGSKNKHVETIQREYGSLENINIHVGVSTVAELMAAADVAIGGGGGMMLERCCLGLPSITVSIALNQIKFSKAMGALGVSIDLGEFENLKPGQVAAALSTLLGDQSLVRDMQEKAAQVMQVSGPSLVQFMLGKSV